MRIAIAGATGLVGRALVRARLAAGDAVLALTRSPERAREVLPSGTEAVRTEDAEAALAGADAVVNLAGEPLVGRRWNEAVKEEIRRSRVDGTRALVRAAAAARDGPRVLVSASAVGYYGPRDFADPVDEDSPPGDDFVARLCADWEAAARDAEGAGIRVAVVRIGVVLDPEGGALPRMAGPMRWFLGGRIGSGRQPFPFVHRDDLTGILGHALDRTGVSGALNAVAPGCVTNAEFAKALGRALRRPAWLPAPAFAVRLLLGGVAGTVLTGQRPAPRRTTESGYGFRFPDADSALRDLYPRRES